MHQAISWRGQSLPGHRACLPIGPRAQQRRVDVYSLTRVLASGTLATLCLPESVAVPSSLRGCQDSRLLGLAYQIRWGTHGPSTHTPARGRVVLPAWGLMPTGLGAISCESCTKGVFSHPLAKGQYPPRPQPPGPCWGEGGGRRRGFSPLPR